MIASERKLHILRMLSASGVINLKDVARALDTSETTIRRDFERLEQDGHLRRVQGGAMRKEGTEEPWDAPLPSITEQRLANRIEKRAVAQAAASVVNDGDNIFLDSGSSLMPLGEILLRRKVQIVTNNTRLLGRGNGAAQVVLAGGSYRASYHLTCGPIAKAAVEQFRFDHAFLGCCGFSLEQQNAYTLEMDAVEVKRAGMESAANCYLLCDHAKYAIKGASKDAPVVISVISQDATSASITGRTTGFVNKMKEIAEADQAGLVAVTGHDTWAAPSESGDVAVEILVSIAASTSVADCQTAAQAVIQRSPVGIFCTNSGSVDGLLAATADGSDLDRENGRYKDIVAVGFDSGATLLNAVRNKWFDGAVTQDPYQIGYKAVELAVKALNGETVPEVVDTGCQYYTSENMDDPAIAALLYE